MKFLFQFLMLSILIPFCLSAQEFIDNFLTFELIDRQVICDRVEIAFSRLWLHLCPILPNFHKALLSNILGSIDVTQFVVEEVFHLFEILIKQVLECI